MCVKHWAKLLKYDNLDTIRSRTIIYVKKNENTNQSAVRYNIKELSENSPPE